VATSHKFSRFSIGEETLPILCAEFLLDREHTIYRIISSVVAVNDRARERERPRIDPKNANIVTFLSQRPYDCSFSLVNAYISIFSIRSRYLTVLVRGWLLPLSYILSVIRARSSGSGNQKGVK
jgi:hypothetical protein